LLVFYLVSYIKLRPKSHSLFLAYPIVTIPFIIYFLVIKIYVFLEEATATEAMEIPFIISPLSHAIIFMIVLKKLHKSKSEDEITLKDDSYKESFIGN